MHERPMLDRAALERLRAIARAIQRDDGRAAPLEHLVRLAREVRLDAGVTIDLEASRELGGPLLVVRLPDRDDRPGCLASLSPREREVADAVGCGEGGVQSRLAVLEPRSSALQRSGVGVDDAAHQIAIAQGHRREHVMARAAGQDFP